MEVKKYCNVQYYYTKGAIDMRFYLHDRNNVPEREKITYYSNAEGDLIKEDLPQNLKSAKETLFREGSGGHEFLVTFMGKEYISIENSFSSDNQEYLNLDFEPCFLSTE